MVRQPVGSECDVCSDHALFRKKRVMSWQPSQYPPIGSFTTVTLALLSLKSL